MRLPVRLPPRLLAALLTATVWGSTQTAAVVGEYFEGNRLVAYADTGGVWTICKGHTEGVKPGDVATPEQCEQYHAQDLKVSAAAVDTLLTRDVGTLCRAALIDFAYNAGISNLRKSTMLRKFNAGDMAGGAAEFDRWVYVAGKDCRKSESNCGGIVIRRAVERWMCEVEP